LGAIFFSIPHYKTEAYEPQPNAPEFVLKMFGLCQVSQIPCAEEDVGSSNMALFVLGQIMIGLGSAPLYCLAPAYLDEIIKPKRMPLAILLWYTTLFVGPVIGLAVGGMFLQTYIDIDQVSWRFKS
jgi:MFS family permease